MEKSYYLELDSFFLPKTPIPVYSERNAQVFARTFNPPVYNPSYPTRDEVRKSNYSRRQDQMQSQGFYTPNTKPYKEIGGPLVLDARQLTILSLTQPTNTTGGFSDATLFGDAAVREQDEAQKNAPDRSVAKDEVASVANSEESNEQRLRLYRLKHQGELMDVKKEAKAIQWMSRFVSNGLPLFSLINRVDDFRNMAKHGAYAQVLNRATRTTKEDNKSVNSLSSGLHTESSASPISAASNNIDGESSSDESDSAESSTSNKVNSETDLPRPYSANYNRIGVQIPNEAAYEHLYRQLCALCWLLDAIGNTDPNMTVCPIVQSWSLQGLTNMKVNVHETQQSRQTIDNSWSSFVSHHHQSHANVNATGIGVKRSNLKQGGSKYAGSNTELRRTGHGAGASIINSDGLNESIDLPLGDLANGGLTDRLPPTIAETPTSAGPSLLQSASSVDALQQQHLQQQAISAVHNSDLPPANDGAVTSGSHQQQPVQAPVATVHLQTPPSSNASRDELGPTNTSSARDDQRNKNSSQPRYRSAQSNRPKQNNNSNNVRNSFSAQSEKKPSTAPGINYRRLMRDREFLTLKLNEVEVEIDREERFRAFRRSHRQSSVTFTGGSNSNNNLENVDYSGGNGAISRDMLELTNRAPSARYNALANKSQHRFKSTAEEQALIVSDTLHQMDSRRMELFRLKLETLETSSGASVVTSKSEKISASPNNKSATSASRIERQLRVAETFDRATKRLRAKTAAAERQRRRQSERANEERQRNWLGSLRSCLPQELMNDWRCRKILERLERHIGLRPNQTTDLNRFLDTLKTLRSFEICDPDVAAAVEFCRERILHFPVAEFEDFFRKHFAGVMRPEKPDPKKKHHRHHHQGSAQPQ